MKKSSAPIKCTIVAGSLSLLVLGCTPVAFEQQMSAVPDSPLLIAQPDTNLIASYHFPVVSGKVTHTQIDLANNQTSLSFQIQDSQGNFINDISTQDLVIRENGTDITDYSMAANQQAIHHTADIILAIDVTGSMSPTIESAKARLIHFIDSSRAQGYRTRICILTFGDYTIQSCNRFYNNDPQDPSSASEVAELKTEIARLRALMGVSDPGGSDFNENPMRALIDASKAPWKPDSQRFVILVTDDGFLYSPSNQGEVGRLAPYMSEVRSAINESQMRVFAVTPSSPGYNNTFRVRENSWVTYPSIVEMSNGEHFLFSDLIAGRITLSNVLNRILSNILTTYQVNYIADNNPGLKPHLPLASRRIQVNVVGRPELRVSIVSKTSNLPDGRQEYPTEWTLSDRSVIKNSVRVKIDGESQHGSFELQGSRIRFKNAPRSRAKIEIEYDYEYLADALALEQITLPKNVDIHNISVFINAVKASKNDIRYLKNLEGQWIVEISEQALTHDVFKIRELKGASLQIFEAKTK